ncbi:MAG: hypothetical protein WCO55_03695 [Candidatus Falkowbacteria bacterium]
MSKEEDTDIMNLAKAFFQKYKLDDSEISSLKPHPQKFLGIFPKVNNCPICDSPINYFTVVNSKGEFPLATINQRNMNRGGFLEKLPRFGICQKMHYISLYKESISAYGEGATVKRSEVYTKTNKSFNYKEQLAC